jgi:hypothetical protein
MKQMRNCHVLAHHSVEHLAFIALLRPRYRHIAHRLELIWGSPECDAYLNGLFLARDPDKGPMRNGRPARVGAGFPKPAMRVIKVLREIHPHFAQNTPRGDAWGAEMERRMGGG